MNKIKGAYIQLHIAVLLFGFTAILGDLISLSALVLVWWRVLITCISLLFFIQYGKTLLAIPKKLILKFMGIGVLVAIHWITFFGAVKYSNASICLVAMATTSFFTSFLEPLILKKPFKAYEMILGLLIIPGMILVVNNIEVSMLKGIWVGMISAFLASLFAIFNKGLVDKADSYSITFIELGAACLFITLLFPFYYKYDPTAAFLPAANDLVYLLILALLCTTLAYILSLKALKYISAFAANLTINLEPVYGIILAWLILNENEQLNMGFYLGSALIILAVLCYPALKKRLG